MPDLTNDQQRLLDVRNELREIHGRLRELQAAPSLRMIASAAATSVDDVLYDINEWMGWAEDEG